MPDGWIFVKSSYHPLHRNVTSESIPFGLMTVKHGINSCSTIALRSLKRFRIRFYYSIKKIFSSTLQSPKALSLLKELKQVLQSVHLSMKL